MSKNVFWKSTFRKSPVGLLLLVLLGVLSFNFTSRVVEYLTIHQEIQRLGDSYHAIGTLEPNEVHGENVADGVEMPAQSEYVGLLNRCEHLSGEMTEMYNTDFDGQSGNILGIHNAEILAWAEFEKAERGNKNLKFSDYYVTFTVKECLTGYPELRRKDSSIRCVYKPKLPNELDYALSELVPGETYLIRYYPTQNGATLHPVWGEDCRFLNEQDGQAMIPEMMTGMYEIWRKCAVMLWMFVQLKT